jgi:isochorismate pyruvate lyase
MKVAHPILAELRAEIDAVDAELVALLQKRFEIAERVIALKSREGIPAALPDRVEQVVQNVLRRAGETNVPAHTIEAVWRALIAETIVYEETRLGKTP